MGTALCQIKSKIHVGVWFAARYLLPCTHVMLSQRRAIRETDMYGKSADKFLALIPECCRLSAAPSADRDEDSAFWGKGEQQLSHI